MSRVVIAQVGVLVGLALVVAGVALVWPPLALVVAGAGVGVFFLKVYDVDGGS